MKPIRLISLLLAISVLLAFSACSRSAEPTSPSKEQLQENQSTSESEQNTPETEDDFTHAENEQNSESADLPHQKTESDNIISDKDNAMKRVDVSCSVHSSETGIIEGESVELSLNVPADWIQSDTGRMFYLEDGILKAAEGFWATIIPEGQTIRSTAKVNLNMGYISSKTVNINGQEVLLSIDFVPWDKNEKEPPEDRKVYCYAYHIPYQDMYITIQFYAVRKDNEEAMQLHKEILESICFVEDNPDNSSPKISE